MSSKRWMAEVTYRDGTKPLFIEFEEIADLHDSVAGTKQCPFYPR